jgi:hypothetical protein
VAKSNGQMQIELMVRGFGGKKKKKRGAFRSADHCAIAQCPSEDCDSSSAFFYQVQIRSADEPMTTFYKVGSQRSRTRKGSHAAVYGMRPSLAGKLILRFHFGLGFILQ